MNNKKFRLSDLRESVQRNYLPSNFIDRLRAGELLIMCNSGFVALVDDTTMTDCGCVYHSIIEEGSFGWDEIDEVIRPMDELVEAYGRNGREVMTIEENCEEYRGWFYVTDFLSDNDMVRIHDGSILPDDRVRYVCSEGEYYHEDDCYYWESDGEYHLDPEEEEEEEEETGTLWGYSAGPREKSFVFSDVEPAGFGKFGWGIEIEKNELPAFSFDKQEVYDRTGAVLEFDGSVSDGFELKTPVYNLFSEKTPERLAELREFCNIKKVDGAGGHIGFSMEGKTDEELLNLCRGFIPLIYAMHKKRIGNSFCQAKKIPELISDNCKYQSIRLRGNYIEFRIFSSVKTFETVLFRFEFFKIMARNLGANFAKVLLMASNINHPLFKLLSKVYDDEKKMTRLLTDCILLNQQFGTGRITADSIAKIEKRIKDVFKK